jgi:TPR repeat protein
LLLVRTYRTIRHIIPDENASAGVGTGTIGTTSYTMADKIMAITNAPNYESLANGSKVNERAIHIGTVTENGETYELWDCGAIYVPPPPTREQVKVAEEAAKTQRAAAELAKKNASEKTLKWNQDQAAVGDAYGQLRMGERYRDGDGVETNIVKARAYFMQSSAQGNATAAEELHELEHE